MRKSTFKTKSLLILAILFGGCSSSSDTLTPSTTPSQEIPTSIPSLTVTSTTTDIPPTATTSPTPEPSFTPSATYDPFSGRRLISPDGEWTAIDYYDNELEPPLIGLIEIKNVDGSIVWEIPSFWDFEQFPNVLESIITNHMNHWSPDSKYLYYYLLVVGDGGEYYFNGHTLRRINIHNGLTTRVLPGNEPKAFTFSPSEKFIAFIRYYQNPLKIIVMDLETWEQKSVSIKIGNPGKYNYDVGKITWSPDEKFLIYFTYSYSEDNITGEITNIKSSIVRLDLDTYIQTTLSEEIMFVYSTEWAEDGRLEISGRNGAYLLDPQTGELEK